MSTTVPEQPLAPQPFLPATLSIDYPERDLDRLSTALRLLWAIPILIVAGAIERYSVPAGGVLTLPTLLMLVARRKYPKWWFDWNLELTKFSIRVSTYLALMDDRYPSTDDEQSVHVTLTDPGRQVTLNRWLPLVKWLLAIPHFLVLVVLSIASVFAVVGAWFAILATGRYPRGLFTFVEGVMRWQLRVAAYAFLLTTDEYPPFRLAA